MGRQRRQSLSASALCSARNTDSRQLEAASSNNTFSRYWASRLMPSTIAAPVGRLRNDSKSP